MNRRRLMKSGINIDPVTGRGFVNGYEVVDLGLPNGLLWATCNVGAELETNYGSYYMYGKGSKKYNSSDSWYPGTENPLASAADTATQVMGSEWRMPRKHELELLINNTNYEWVSINGTPGGKFTSKTNPNAYVFFPASGSYSRGSLNAQDIGGYIWSSTSNSELLAYYLACDEDDTYARNIYRYYGYPVRGVIYLGEG